MKKNITSKEIAKICGISQATVSYVLNNRTDMRISQQTIDKVKKVMKEYNYVPNKAARSMKTQKCTAIGIVCAWDYSRQSFLDTIEGIGRYLNQMNYTLTLFYEEKEDVSPSYIDSYLSNLIDGLIYISNKKHEQFIAPAEEYGIPYVVVCMDGVFSKKSPRPHAFDDVLIECAEFCRDKSLKRIHYFSVDNEGVFVNDKFPQFKSIVSEIYPECRLEHVIIPVPFRCPENIYPALKKHMDTHDFDIAISHNYDIGYLIQREVFKDGCILPQHPKNLIINNVDFYAITYPSVTGISIPYHQMGRYAAKLILAILDGKEDDFTYQEFTCRLIHRQSTM